MRILFVSDILLTGDFVLTLQDEGHDVKLYIHDKRCKEYLDNLVPKTNNWKKELDWVGKEGLIVFDDVGYGKDQDELRKLGYTVFGGSELGEKMEIDREFGQRMLSKAGVDVVPLHNFSTVTDAVEFVSHNPDKWVLKYSTSDHSLKHFAYLGDRKDGSDVVSVLKNYDYYDLNGNVTISLQKRIEGIEIGVARFFNGTDWVGPIEYNVEHTRLFPNNAGPTVDEMGTLLWYADNEKEKLYASTLAKLKPFLQKANFRGDFDIDCIVNKDGVHPIEMTARLGSPVIHVQETFLRSPWGEMLHAIASGKKYDIDWDSGYGIAVSVVVPPFPYPHVDSGKAMLGAHVILDETIVDGPLKNIHFDEIKSTDGTFKNLRIAGTWGNPMYVTGYSKTVTGARRKAYNQIKKIYIPRMFYREDIGIHFMKHDLPKLKQWGYLK